MREHRPRSSIRARLSHPYQRGRPVQQPRYLFNCPAALAAAVPAIAGDLDYVLVYRVAAVIAAIFRIARYRAAAGFVFTFIIIGHDKSPLVMSNFATSGNTLIISQQNFGFNTDWRGEHPARP